MSIGTFLCAWGAALANFGYVSAIAWSAIISRHVKRCIIGDTKTGMYSIKRQEFVRYSIFGWGLPLLLQGIPFLVNGPKAYSDIFAHCGYSHQFEDLRFYTVFIPVWLLILYNIWVYIHIRSEIFGVYRKVLGLSDKVDKKYLLNVPSSTSNVENNPNVFSETERKLAFKVYSCFLTLSNYPLVQVIAWLPATVLRIYNIWIPSSNSPFWFKFIALIFLILNPFLNGLIFLSYPSVRKLIKIYNCCNKYTAAPLRVSSTLLRYTLEDRNTDYDSLIDIEMDDGEYDEYFGDSATVQFDSRELRFSLRHKDNKSIAMVSGELTNALL